ncbi:MAG TPA: molybdenum cofactor guanylyltransferase [Pyrinomonadaceae bacterium]
MQIQAFILAGGQSRRMGTDKSRLRINNQTFTDKIAAALLPLTESVTLVGAHQQHAGFQSVPDVYPMWGALGGLHAALANCRREWALVVACDLPFVTEELFNFLAPLRAHYDAVVPLQPDNRPQPLSALYRVEPCLQRATELIQAGQRRPLDLLELVNTRWVPFSDLTNLDQAERFFANINTPDDYEAATMRELD